MSSRTRRRRNITSLRTLSSPNWRRRIDFPVCLGSLRQPLIQMWRRSAVITDIDCRPPMIIMWQPPAADCRFARKLFCIDHASMRECPFVGAPTAFATLGRPEITTGFAHPRNGRLRGCSHGFGFIRELLCLGVFCSTRPSHWFWKDILFISKFGSRIEDVCFLPSRSSIWYTLLLNSPACVWRNRRHMGANVRSGLRLLSPRTRQPDRGSVIKSIGLRVSENSLVDLRALCLRRSNRAKHRPLFQHQFIPLNRSNGFNDPVTRRC